MTTKQETIQARGPDGKPVTIIIPRTRYDVEMQPHIPAYTLATLAYSSLIEGHRRWSQYTLDTLKRISAQYGDDVMRRMLCALLDETAAGFRPTNPIGLLIHRTRTSANTDTLVL